MNFDLDQDQVILQNMCRNFAQKEVAPKAAAMDETEEFPYDLIEKMSDLGLMGIIAPEEYGGSGLDTVSYVAALEEIARADVTLALTWQVHNLVTSMYMQFASEEQKREWLPRAAAGKILLAIAMTEPNAGSDSNGIQTRAVRQGEDWIINGNKIFITNAGTDISNGLVLITTSGEREGGKKEFTALIVPKGTPGFIVGNRFRKIGWCSMDTRELIFEDCRVSQANMFGPRGGGLRQALAGLELGRIAFGAISTGLAQACLDKSLEHAKTRVQFRTPLAKFQAIQFKLADMKTKIEAARALTYKAAWLRDCSKPYCTEAALAKLFASRIAVEVVDEAFQIHGGYGLMKECDVSRYYRDAKMMEIGEGTNEIQRLLIARDLGC